LYVLVCTCVCMCGYVYIMCMYVYSYICMYVGVYVCVCTCGVHVWVHVLVCCVCVLILISLSVCVWLRGIAISNSFVQFEPVTGDPDPIRIRIHCGPDILAIRRPTHEMIRRSVLVRAVKTKLRFGSKIALFYVSVCSCVISLFTVVTGYLCFTRIISCDHLIYFTSMITRITSWDINDRSAYLFSWYEHLSASFHVILSSHYWFRTSCDIR